MGGIATVAAAIGADLAARLPRQNKKQREGLALLVATALDVRDVNLMELAAALSAQPVPPVGAWPAYPPLSAAARGCCKPPCARPRPRASARRPGAAVRVPLGNVPGEEMQPCLLLYSRYQSRKLRRRLL